MPEPRRVLAGLPGLHLVESQPATLGSAYATARLMAAIEAATLQQQPAGAAEAAAALPQRSLRDGLYASCFPATARRAEPGTNAP